MENQNHVYNKRLTWYSDPTIIIKRQIRVFYESNRQLVDSCVIREIKIRVYDKQANVNLYHMT